MNSAAQDMWLIWLADVFRPEGAPTNQPQASPGEQAIIKPPSPERALQRDEGGTSLSLRRAWFSVTALTTTFTRIRGVRPTPQQMFLTPPEVSLDPRRAERQVTFMVNCQCHWFSKAANRRHISRISKHKNH